MVVPTALAATTSPVVDGLIADGTVRDGQQPDNTKDIYPGLPSDAIMVVTPGTDDVTMTQRIQPIIGTRETVIVNYPESFGPIIAGKSGTLPFLAPTYDASKNVAIAANLDIMQAFHDSGGHPLIVYTGFSQGADALGDAAETASKEGLLDNSIIILVSDPRGPWGIKAWVAGMPLLPQLAGVIGVESNGARNPADTGNTEVKSVIIVGDPVGNFQWVWYRPVSSLAVDLAGFLTIHSGNGPETYANLDELGDPTVYQSADGNTTYEVYDAHHPLALLNAMVYDELGIPYTADDLDRWDRAAEAFYPIQEPTADNAAVEVTKVSDGSSTQSTSTQSTSTQSISTPGTTARSYEVTVPAEVATGQSQSIQNDSAPSGFAPEQTFESSPAETPSTPEPPATTGTGRTDATGSAAGSATGDEGGNVAEESTGQTLNATSEDTSADDSASGDAGGSESNAAATGDGSGSEASADASTADGSTDTGTDSGSAGSSGSAGGTTAD
ncbi:hypothetical protein GORHZ_247_00550 [Gordonia rhizosphera NBRC 16068]|uniref:PE-PPE domain-containing protein n=2 Tax=Gordonia rhizosphera TaxID=83341 RepID=K6WP65_9ACTN|nr:hypothetical protein GORHZ_247_00550 [Gordonia rhizosphera NBRC 16068]